jgi:plasmid stability protein
MTLTIDLKDLPDELYHQLKRAAAANGRTLSEEAAVCLGNALQPGGTGALGRLGRALALQNDGDAPPEPCGTIEELVRKDLA